MFAVRLERGSKMTPCCARHYIHTCVYQRACRKASLIEGFVLLSQDGDQTDTVGRVEGGGEQWRGAQEMHPTE
jgi:hypothetical protein